MEGRQIDDEEGKRERERMGWGGGMLTPETKGQTASRVEGNRQKITANEKIPLARLTQYRNCGLLTHNLFGGSRRSSCVRADSWREQERKIVASPIVSHKQLSFLGHSQHKLCLIYHYPCQSVVHL